MHTWRSAKRTRHTRHTTPPSTSRRLRRDSRQHPSPPATPAPKAATRPVQDAPSPTVRYLAIITDGNGRWAQAHGLPVHAGHEVGADTLKARILDAADLGVRELTIYSFSTENWSRPEQETKDLIAMFATRIAQDTPDLHQHNVRIRFIGHRHGLTVGRCAGDAVGFLGIPSGFGQRVGVVVQNHPSVAARVERPGVHEAGWPSSSAIGGPRKGNDGRWIASPRPLALRGAHDETRRKPVAEPDPARSARVIAEPAASRSVWAHPMRRVDPPEPEQLSQDGARAPPMAPSPPASDTAAASS